MKRILHLTIVTVIAGCSSSSGMDHFQRGMVPAEVFARSVKSGQVDEFSIYRLNENGEQVVVPSVQDKYAAEGYTLKKSISAPVTITDVANKKSSTSPTASNGAPAGSQAPYYRGQMTANPSLWPDGADTDSMFRDLRAYQPMDVITITINEKNQGKKKADSKAESSLDVLAGISNFFGLESKKWESNNADLDPTALIKANTESKFDSKGETKREGSLTGKISAVIMEVLPNGLLRIEGTKIVSMNSEEEVMVISGLIRTRDVDAQNMIESSRVANMRIDFYGKGVLGDVQEPGWLYNIFKTVWPF